jgi:hypothetical protein
MRKKRKRIFIPFNAINKIYWDRCIKCMMEIRIENRQYNQQQQNDWLNEWKKDARKLNLSDVELSRSKFSFNSFILYSIHFDSDHLSEFYNISSFIVRIESSSPNTKYLVFSLFCSHTKARSIFPDHDLYWHL